MQRGSPGRSARHPSSPEPGQPGEGTLGAALGNRGPPPTAHPRLRQRKKNEMPATSGRRSPRGRGRPAWAPAGPEGTEAGTRLAPRGAPPNRPATPASPRAGHSLLHSSSAQTLSCEKRRPGAGSGWPGTGQGGPSRSSQSSSPGAAAMLWSLAERVTRRRRRAAGRRPPGCGAPSDTSARSREGMAGEGPKEAGGGQARPPPRLGLRGRLLPSRPTAALATRILPPPSSNRRPVPLSLRSGPSARFHGSRAPLRPWAPPPPALVQQVFLDPFSQLQISGRFPRGSPSPPHPFLVWYLLSRRTRSHPRFTTAGVQFGIPLLLTPRAFLGPHPMIPSN